MTFAFLQIALFDRKKLKLIVGKNQDENWGLFFDNEKIRKRSS